MQRRSERRFEPPHAESPPRPSRAGAAPVRRCSRKQTNELLPGGRYDEARWLTEPRRRARRSAVRRWEMRGSSGEESVSLRRLGSRAEAAREPGPRLEICPASARARHGARPRRRCGRHRRGRRSLRRSFSPRFGAVRALPDPARRRPMRAPRSRGGSAAARRTRDLVAHRRHSCCSAAGGGCAVLPRRRAGRCCKHGGPGRRATLRRCRRDPRPRARRSARHGRLPQAELSAHGHPHRAHGGRRRVRATLFRPSGLGGSLLHERRRDGRPGGGASRTRVRPDRRLRRVLRCHRCADVSAPLPERGANAHSRRRLAAERSHLRGPRAERRARVARPACPLLSGARLPAHVSPHAIRACHAARTRGQASATVRSHGHDRR